MTSFNITLLRLAEDSRRWLCLMLAVALLGIGWIWATRAPTAPTADATASPRAGFAAPDFSLETLNGRTVKLSELREQAVMINLWASWCPPCRQEMPDILHVYEAYKDRGFVVLAVNTTFQDAEPDVRAFAEEFGLTFPILLDTTGAVSQRYQLRALPTTFFVDRRGLIQDVVYGGPMSRALMESKIEKIISP